MRNKKLQSNIDNSDLVNFPDGRIKNNDGSGNGTPINEQVKGDIHEFFDKALRLYGISHNGFPDNEANGYQTIEAVRALASKNDFVLNITSVSGILNVPVKLSKMLDNEQIVCKVQVDKSAETEIKGSDNSQFVVSFIGDFKANEYVRLIKTASSVILVRLVDLVNLDLAVSEFFYLKKANQTQENAGILDTVATTPSVNKVAFTKRVIGLDSGDYLATPSNNGLLSATDKIIIDGIGTSPVRNIGWFGGLDVGVTTGALATNGNISSAIASTGSPGETFITVNLSNTMTDINYFVRIHVESTGSLGLDNDIKEPVFKIISSTQFIISIGETAPSSQNLKVHIEAYKL